MAELTVETISRSGLNPSLVAADSGGDTAQQDGDAVFLYVNNADSAGKQVTVTAKNTAKQVPGWGELSASDAVASVPAGEFRLIGPFPRAPYTGTLEISYDDVTSVTVAAIKLPRE